MSEYKKFFYYPLYLEPIVYSGERLVVAIAFKDTEGNEAKVYETTKPEVWELIYNNGGKALASYANDAIKSMQDWCTNLNSKWSDYIAPFEGLYQGEQKTVFDNNIDDAIAQVVENISSLSAVRFVNSNDEGFNHSSVLNRIQNQVVTKNQIFKNRFKKETKLWDKTYSLDYVGNKYAMNFAVLNPKATNFSQQQDRTTSYAVQLNSIRTHQVIGRLEEYAISIIVPDSSLLTNNESQRLDTSLTHLEKMFDDIEIRGRHYTNTDEVCDLLLADA